MCVLFSQVSRNTGTNISSYGSLYGSLFGAQPFLTLISFFILAPITDPMFQFHCSTPCFRDMSCSSMCLCHHLSCSLTWHSSLPLSSFGKPIQFSRFYWDVISSGKPETGLDASSSPIQMDYITAISEPLYFLIYTFIFSSNSTFWLV